MAEVMSDLKMTAPGMWATCALVCVALAALLWMLGEYSHRAAMRHHDEALERERAAALAEDDSDLSGVCVVTTTTDDPTLPSDVVYPKEMRR